MFEQPWSELVYRSERDKSEGREKGSKVKKLSTVVEVGRFIKKLEL